MKISELMYFLQEIFNKQGDSVVLVDSSLYSYFEDRYKVVDKDYTFNNLGDKYAFIVLEDQDNEDL